MRRKFVENGGRYQFVSQPTFSKIWTAFVDKQKWKYDLHCPYCDRQDAHGEVDYINYDGMSVECLY